MGDEGGRGRSVRGTPTPDPLLGNLISASILGKSGWANWAERGFRTSEHVWGSLFCGLRGDCRLTYLDCGPGLGQLNDGFIKVVTSTDSSCLKRRSVKMVGDLGEGSRGGAGNQSSFG